MSIISKSRLGARAVRSKAKPGEITLTARCGQLRPASLSLASQPVVVENGCEDSLMPLAAPSLTATFEDRLSQAVTIPGPLKGSDSFRPRMMPMTLESIANNMNPTSIVSSVNQGASRPRVMMPLLLKLALGMSLVLATIDSHAQMAVKGNLLLQDDFNTLQEYTKVLQPLTNGWQVRVWHATWKRTTDGIESRWESGHNPVLGYEGPFSNVVIEVDFRYRDADAQNAYLRVNPANRQLDPRAYTVSAWANASSKARPRGLILEHEEWRTQGYL
ncbi:MAG: hypothetical protein ACTHKU_02005, partial [Verrucomicrobiota bacterium]